MARRADTHPSDTLNFNWFVAVGQGTHFIHYRYSHKEISSPSAVIFFGLHPKQSGMVDLTFDFLFFSYFAISS
jgi:hypothetical protein